MIRSLETTAPRALRYVGEKLQNLESKLKKIGYIPFVSVITGGVEVLGGLAGAVTAGTSAIFYKARLHVPLISKQTKILWAKRDDVKTSMQLLMDSINMVAMGVLKAVPGFGNYSAFMVYSSIEQQRAAEKAKGEADVQLAEKNNQITDLEKDLAETAAKLQVANENFNASQEVLSKKTVEVASKIEEIAKLTESLKILQQGAGLEELGKLRTAISEKETELKVVKEQLQAKTVEGEGLRNQIKELQEKTKTEEAALHKKITAKEDELKAARKDLEKAKVNVQMLQEAIDELKTNIPQGEKVLQEKLLAKERELVEQIKILEASRDDVTQLTEVIKKLKAEFESKSIEHAEALELKVNELKVKDEELLRLNEGKKVIADELAQARGDLEQLRQAKDTEIGSLQDRLKQEQESLARVSMQLKGEQERVAELSSENKRLQERLRTAQKAKVDVERKQAADMNRPTSTTRKESSSRAYHTRGSQS